VTHYVGVGIPDGYGDDATAVTIPGATVTIAAPGDGDGLGGYVHIYY